MPVKLSKQLFSKMIEGILTDVTIDIGKESLNATNLPQSGNYWSQCGVNNGHIYIIGGFKDGYLSNIYQYDLSNNKWSLLACLNRLVQALDSTVAICLVQFF